MEPRLCIVSFNTAPPKGMLQRQERLHASFDAARDVSLLHIKPLRVQPLHGREARKHPHAYMKRVWMETMQRVWRLLEPYDGDVLFLEDDLLVAPDFFQVLKEVSNFKRAVNGTQVFAMGGWGGENMFGADPAVFLRRTSRAFPTMGYGFNRSLWRRIEQVAPEILEGRGAHGVVPLEHDWSDAVAQALTREYKRTHDRELSSFAIGWETEVIQPTLSRVWHVGHQSTIGTDGRRHVSGDAPWSGHVELLASGQKLNHTLKGGRHNPVGRPCQPGHPCAHDDAAGRKFNPEVDTHQGSKLGMVVYIPVLVFFFLGGAACGLVLLQKLLRSTCVA